MAKQAPVSEEIKQDESVAQTQEESLESKQEESGNEESLESKPEESPAPKPEVEVPTNVDGSEIVDFKKHTIIILKDHNGLIKDSELVVSGNVAKALIIKEIAKLK